ncbi:MAG: DUF2513 domain-containing protein [Bacillota bacterium]|nr:DUF2513 domain-containing protein [Bacillota bacterium]
MKLNHECVRDLMLAFEDVPYGGRPQMDEIVKFNQLSNYSVEDICYCTEKLMQAGYINFQRVKGLGVPFDGIFIEITWEGHQFLDTIKSDTVWEKAKDKVTSTVGTVSLQTLSALAVSIGSKLLGI